MIKTKNENIRRSRILKGLSQGEMAKGINLNSASYCLIENGKLGVKPKTAISICRLLDKSFDELFEITEKGGERGEKCK